MEVMNNCYGIELRNKDMVLYLKNENEKKSCIKLKYYKFIILMYILLSIYLSGISKKMMVVILSIKSIKVKGMFP
jgi:hypothetical protein